MCNTHAVRAAIFLRRRLSLDRICLRSVGLRSVGRVRVWYFGDVKALINGGIAGLVEAIVFDGDELNKAAGAEAVVDDGGVDEHADEGGAIF